MSERTQINVVQGDKTICIYSGWGTPSNILPALRAAVKTGYSKPLDIAREIIRQVPDASFGLRIVSKTNPDFEEYFQEDALSYRYVVNVTKPVWRVKVTRMPHIKLKDGGNNTLVFDKEVPAKTSSIRIAA